MKKWILLFLCMTAVHWASASSCSNLIAKLTQRHNKNTAEASAADAINTQNSDRAAWANRRNFLVQEILNTAQKNIPEEMFTAEASSIGLNINKGFQRLAKMLKKNIGSYTEETTLQLQTRLADPNQRSQAVKEEILKAFKKWKSRRRVRIALATTTGVVLIPLIPPASFYLVWLLADILGRG